MSTVISLPSQPKLSKVKMRIITDHQDVLENYFSCRNDLTDGYPGMIHIRLRKEQTAINAIHLALGQGRAIHKTILPGKRITSGNFLEHQEA